MPVRTLRRRGGFYRRRRSRWRLNLALALVGAALAGFVVIGMNAGTPAPGPAGDTAKRIAAAAPTAKAPAPTAAVALGPTALAAAATTPTSAPTPRAGRARSQIAHLDAGAAPVGEPSQRAAAPGPLARAAPASPGPLEGCKTCSDEVPF